MSGKFASKFMGFLGLEEEVDEIEELENEARAEEEEEEIDNIFSSAKHRGQNNKVVSIHTSASTKIMILKPSNYDEAVQICDNLKNRKIIVVNMISLDKKIAQRLLDFMGGASYALGGSLEEIEKGVYIISPSNVEVSNELKSELSSKGLINWVK